MRILILFVVLGLVGSCQSVAKDPDAGKPKPKIEGVVTYFFNKYQGDKPDLGAVVYLKEIDSVHLETVIDTFNTVSFNRNIEAAYRGIGSNAPKGVTETLEMYGIKTDQDFDSLDARAYRRTQPLTIYADVSTVVDGSGRYSLEAPKSGRYAILIQSKGRDGITLSQASGKIFYKEFTIKAGETKNISAEFSQY